MNKKSTGILHSSLSPHHYPTNEWLSTLGFASCEAAAEAHLDLSTLDFSQLPPQTTPYFSISGSQPILAHIPHAGIYQLSEPYLKIDFIDFKRNALSLTDWMTDDLFSSLTIELQGSAVINRINRFYFDPERYSNRLQEPMEKIGMGVFYRTGCDLEPIRNELSNNEFENLLEKYYQPYHQSLNELANRSYQTHGELMVVDCHSFPAQQLPYEGTVKTDRPDICLGVNDINSSKRLIDLWQDACESSGFTFGVNTPFAGTLIPSSVSGLPQVLGFMIEVNRGLYLDDYCLAPRYEKTKLFLEQTLFNCFKQRSALYNNA